MKKIIRTLTLVLVLVMTVSMLAIPAMASVDYTDECSLDAEPRYPIYNVFCPSCNVKMDFGGYNYTVGKGLYICPICGYECMK